MPSPYPSPYLWQAQFLKQSTPRSSFYWKLWLAHIVTPWWLSPGDHMRSRAAASESVSSLSWKTRRNKVALFWVPKQLCINIAVTMGAVICSKAFGKLQWSDLHIYLVNCLAITQDKVQRILSVLSSQKVYEMNEYKQ